VAVHEAVQERLVDDAVLVVAQRIGAPPLGRGRVDEAVVDDRPAVGERHAATFRVLRAGPLEELGDDDEVVGLDGVVGQSEVTASAFNSLPATSSLTNPASLGPLDRPGRSIANQGDSSKSTPGSEIHLVAGERHDLDLALADHAAVDLGVRADVRVEVRQGVTDAAAADRETEHLLLGAAVPPLVVAVQGDLDRELRAALGLRARWSTEARHRTGCAGWRRTPSRR
jgi:hypothetical protein